MNFAEARDEMLSVFKAAWDTTELAAIYPDVPSTKPDTTQGQDSAFARAGVTHAGMRQASLAGEEGARRWNRTGFFWAQIFAPVGDGGQKADELAQLVVNAFQAKRDSEVWYRNARMREVPTNNSAFSQVNVLCDFSYDDVR